MKKNNSSNLIIFLAIALTGLIITAFTPAKKLYSSETRNPGNFNKISLALAADVQLIQGSQCKVEIEADNDDLGKIETEVKNGTLEIKTKNWANNINGKISIKIVMPELEGISVAGSGNIHSDSEFKSDQLKLSVSGSGSILIEKNGASNTNAVITGSGNIKQMGSNTAENINVTITGSGSYNSLGMKVSEAVVTITGSGSAKVNVIKELKTNITGSGSVHYEGDPMVNANSTGSGRTKKL